MKVFFEAITRDVFLYFEYFGVYDYFMVALVLGGFLFFMFMSLAYLFKSPVIGTLFLFCALGFLGYGSYFGFHFVDERWRSRTLEIANIKQLQYSDTFLVDMNLTNNSKKNFRFCRANVAFYRIENDKIKKYLAPYKPFKVVYADAKERIAPAKSVDINMTIYNFRPRDYNITAYSLCF